MNHQQEKMCEICGKRKAQRGSGLCYPCDYRQRVEFLRHLPPEDRDTEFMTCEECGSRKDSDGFCPNQMCGASPYQGRDWI